LNNLLKFIASIITPWIDTISKRLRPGDCALLMTDSTTSAGWLKTTNFLEAGMNPDKSTVRLEIARKHTSHFIHLNIKEYSQWFQGRKIMSPTLSFGILISAMPKLQNTYDCITHLSFPLTFRLYHCPEK
jgi:hypothetical protein